MNELEIINMIFKKTISLAFAMFVPLISFSEAQAAIYKCVNNKEEVYYNDKPCPKNNKESQIKAVKDPVGGYIPPKFKDQNSDEKSENQLVQNNDEDDSGNSKNQKNTSSQSSSSFKEKEPDLSTSSNKNTEIETNKPSVASNKNKEIQEENKLIFH